MLQTAFFQDRFFLMVAFAFLAIGGIELCLFAYRAAKNMFAFDFIETKLREAVRAGYALSVLSFVRDINFYVAYMAGQFHR
jgi:hypothetical protein